MAEQTACNIKFYFYIRLLFGYYHEFSTKRARWIARCYCFLITTSIIVSFFILQQPNIFTKFQYIEVLKYLSYVLFSARKKNAYLQRYYKKLPLVDDTPDSNTYTLLRICIITIMCLLSTLWTCFLCYFIQQFLITTPQVLRCVFNSVLWHAELFEWFHLVFIFGLLYCRVRSLRKMLQNNTFDCRSHLRHPRTYIQTYAMIMDRLDETNDPVQILAFNHLIVIVPDLLLRTTLHFMWLKEQFVPPPVFVTLMICMVMTYTPLLLSAILADLVTAETQEILATVVERRIDCKNERHRAEIQKLFEYLTSQPFSYTLLRVVPLTVRSLLTFLSFSITTAIAVLQVIGYSF